MLFIGFLVRGEAHGNFIFILMRKDHCHPSLEVFQHVDGKANDVVNMSAKQRWTLKVVLCYRVCSSFLWKCFIVASGILLICPCLSMRASAFFFKVFRCLYSFIFIRLVSYQSNQKKERKKKKRKKKKSVLLCIRWNKLPQVDWVYWWYIIQLLNH